MLGFSEDQIRRYARHIVLPQVGGKGQRRLLDAHVLVIGAGGLGSPAALYLAAAYVVAMPYFLVFVKYQGVVDPVEKVALLVDNRSNKASDFRWAMAATATGSATEVHPGQRASTLDLYLAKHPHLKDFVHSPPCALCEIRVQTFIVVTRFQKVVEVHISP